MRNGGDHTPPAAHGKTGFENPQSPGCVVFAAFPDLEIAGGADPAFTGIETEHDFSQ